MGGRDGVARKGISMERGFLTLRLVGVLVWATRLCT